MNPADIQTLVAAAQTIAAVLSSLGVPGLIGLGLAGPVVVLVAVMVLDAARAARMEKMHQQFRSDTQEILENYRADMAELQRISTERHAAVSQFYEDNVELVKAQQQMSEGFQTLVINNTRAMERLSVMVERIR